jgi:hypothetical protein
VTAMIRVYCDIASAGLKRWRRFATSLAFVAMALCFVACREQVSDGDLIEHRPKARITCFCTYDGTVDDADLEVLSEEDEVRHLDLRNAANVTDKGLHHLAKWQKLQYLRVDANSVTDKGLTAFANTQRIVTLFISIPNSGDAGLHAFLKNRDLLELSVPRKVTTDGLEVALDAFPSLRILGLYNCENVNDDIIDSLAKLKALEKLYISGTGITDEGKARMKELMPTVVVED